MKWAMLPYLIFKEIEHTNAIEKFSTAKLHGSREVNN
jgi:hypothetical protein